MTKDEALKLALEALKTLHDENMDYLTRNKLGGENNQCMVFAREAITAIKEALAQPEQGPVAWISTGPARMIHWTADKPAYGDDWVPLYTTPPQREFVGLTDEEIDQGLLRSNHALQTAGAWRDGVEWATKQLKEKNT